MTPLDRLVDACLMPGFAGANLPDWAAEALDGGLAGVALYGNNLADERAVTRLSAQVHARRPEALVALDEEGGDVTRLDYRTGSRYPGNLALGQLDDLSATYEVALALAGDLRRAGVDVDLAPSVDVNSDPDNPVIGVRAFGSDAARVARHGSAFVRGVQDGGIAAVAKHFPGHGATTTDSHHALPIVADDEATIRDRDLPPFVAAIEAGVRGVMTGHLLLPAFDAVPATLSRRLLTGLLRDELGFDGVIVTDALDMAGVRERHGIAGAAVLALAAGADLLLLGAEDGEQHRLDVHRAVDRAIADGDLTLGRVEDAGRRVRVLLDARTDEPLAEANSGVGGRVASRALTVRGALPLAEPAVVAELRGTTNLAVGDARWGLADPLRDLGRLADSVQVGPGGATPANVVARAGGRPLVIAVRDAYRTGWQREWISAALAWRRDAVLVCLGMPQDADLGAATVVLAYGAGRANTEAVARRLIGRE
jgi:beta-N-acetylhexosaminidase